MRLRRPAGKQFQWNAETPKTSHGQARHTLKAVTKAQLTAAHRRPGRRVHQAAERNLGTTAESAAAAAALGLCACVSVGAHLPSIGWWMEFNESWKRQSARIRYATLAKLEWGSTLLSALAGRLQQSHTSVRDWVRPKLK